MALLSGQRLRAPLFAALTTAVGLLVATALCVAAAPSAPVTPEDVHAAFTVNLTRFITWPATAFANASAPLVIGTFPQDPINEELDAAVRGETLDGRPMVTVRIRSLDEVARCHIVFMSRNVARHLLVLERCVRRPILTISDANGFLELGGHVQFLPQPPRTKLQISAANLRASGLEARAQLLRLAAAP